MAARSAIQPDPAMKAFHHRLVTDNLRPGKVALVAAMGKMFVALNAIARDRQPWRRSQSPA